MSCSVRDILSYLKTLKKTTPPLLYKVTRLSINQSRLPLYEKVVSRDFTNVESNNYIPCYVYLTMVLLSNPMLCTSPLRLPDGSLSPKGQQIADFIRLTVHPKLHEFNFLSEQELHEYREGLDELVNMDI